MISAVKTFWKKQSTKRQEKNKLEEVNGLIGRASEDYVEGGGGRKTLFFANLEKEILTVKTMARLNKDGREINNPKHILN